MSVTVYAEADYLNRITMITPVISVMKSGY